VILVDKQIIFLNKSRRDVILVDKQIIFLNKSRRDVIFYFAKAY